ncbi:hypothetical protein JCM14076_23290 [Methylosoma difficile]
MRLFAFGILVILLTGCIPLSHNEYKMFALKLVPPGTELVHAITLLNEKGYDCSTKASFKMKPKPKDLLIYCDRSRPGFMYSCLQRIDLDIDENTWRIISNNPEAACTGL